MTAQTAHKDEKILIIKLGALGDFIQGLGPMAAIRKHHALAHITLLTTLPFEGLARQSGYCDQIMIDHRPKWYDLSSWVSMKKFLNGSKFTRIYDLQNNDRTNFYFKLLQHNKKIEWVGASKGASHANLDPDRSKGHAFEGHVQTLEKAGIKNVKIDTLSWVDASISALPLQTPYVLIVPGSSPQHPQKRWPELQYGRTCNILLSLGFQPVLLGTKMDRKILEAIQEASPSSLNLCGQTSIEQIIRLAKGAAFAIGNDTGPIHCIAATGCPTLALFSGFSHPVKHAPRGENVQILRQKNLNDISYEQILEHFSPRDQSAENPTNATMH